MNEDMLTIRLKPEDAYALREALVTRPHDEAWSNRVWAEVHAALANGIDDPKREGRLHAV